MSCLGGVRGEAKGTAAQPGNPGTALTQSQGAITRPSRTPAPSEHGMARKVVACGLSLVAGTLVGMVYPWDSDQPLAHAGDPEVPVHLGNPGHACREPQDLHGRRGSLGAQADGRAPGEAGVQPEECQVAGELRPRVVLGHPGDHAQADRIPGIQKASRGEVVRVWVTRYCVHGCGHRICGTNLKTASGTDARKAGGIASDRRWLPFGTRVRIGDRVYVMDDQFGKAQRERDWRMGRRHIDIRVAGKTHDQVRKMGASWEEVEIEQLPQQGRKRRTE